MNKYNTILGQMIGLVGRYGFEKQVKIYKTEFGAKGFRSWTHFVSMLFGQVSGQHGLRSIEQGMNNQISGWYHLGINNSERQIKRSSLSYANNHRPAALYQAVFEQVLSEAQKQNSAHGLKFKNPLYSIDATTIDLCLNLFPWADFRQNKAGIKLTVKLDHQGKIPCFAVVSNAREHESKKIGEVPLEKGDVVVFDRGYTNYEYFNRLCVQKVWFVTRLKKNAVYRYLEKRPVKEGGSVISDYEIRLSGMAGEQRLRKILIRDPATKKKITLLTNNLVWSARSIGKIYKQRWQIELFFKAIKQNLKIKRFYGNSRNAVMTQIWIALIVYLLFYILKMRSKNSRLSFTTFISVVKTMLFQRVSLFEWLCETSPPVKRIQHPQVNLEFAW